MKKHPGKDDDAGRKDAKNTRFDKPGEYFHFIAQPAKYAQLRDHTDNKWY